MAEYAHDHEGHPLFRLIHGPFLLPQDAVARLRSLALIDDWIEPQK